MLEFEVDTEGVYESFIHSFLIPGMFLGAFVLLVQFIVKFGKSLHVSGLANEWVVLIGSDGAMKQCGVGLNCFRGPFDQVAKFPAKVNKVEFSTQQVTTEMQGVQVSGAIIWTIFRMEDGPFKAYKNLGSDLANRVPKTANENLIA